MAQKPPSSESPAAASAGEPAAPEPEKKHAAIAAGSPARTPDGKATLPAPPAADGDDELDIDDEEDDEDLVVFTAKEAAGALGTIYAFVKPFLKNYKKMLGFVGIGVVVETLFNVIMPLSLKF